MVWKKSDPTVRIRLLFFGTIPSTLTLVALVPSPISALFERVAAATPGSAPNCRRRSS
jgi:hypothetical protein